MKVGLIARAEDRGLGVMTAAFYRAMQPERTLVIDMGELAGGFASHFERYPGELVVPFDGHQLPERRVKPWLRGLDVVYSAETYYDWRIIEWAREAGVRTVLHSMPEFYRSDLTWQPDVVWNPTVWRHSLLPPGAIVVPVPIEDDWPCVPSPPGDKLRVVHVAGHRAAGDRNGTLSLLTALRQVRVPMTVRIHCQDAHLPAMRALSPKVELELRPGGLPSRAELYADADVMVMPRRYGGLSLPAQEALGAGLGLVMSQCAPNPETWPLVALRGRYDGRMNTPGGLLRLFGADPAFLARTLETLARNPARVQAAKEAGCEWASARRWSVLRDTYLRHLAEA